MIWAAIYLAIGAVMARNVASLWPRTPAQALGFTVFALVWPVIACWQIAERIDARIP